MDRAELRGEAPPEGFGEKVMWRDGLKKAFALTDDVSEVMCLSCDEAIVKPLGFVSFALLDRNHCLLHSLLGSLERKFVDHIDS